MNEKCCAWGMKGYVNHRCLKPAKMTHEGRHYCGIHNPVKREVRREARKAEGLAMNRRQIARDEAYRRLVNAAPEMLWTIKHTRDLVMAVAEGVVPSVGETNSILSQIENVIEKAEGKI